MSWEELVAIVVAVLVGGLVAVIFLARDIRSRRVRFGVFVEREYDEPTEPPSSPP